MKFHLSTLLLVILVLALGIGWYLHSTELDRDRIVGRWHNATTSRGSYTTLEIREDGTFTKWEGSRDDVSIYRGTYVLERFGMVTFSVAAMEYLNEDLQEMHESIAKNIPEYYGESSRYKFTKSIDANITCHGYFDAEGILKIETRAVQNPGQHPDKELPHWGSFKKSQTPIAQ